MKNYKLGYVVTIDGNEDRMEEVVAIPDHIVEYIKENIDGNGLVTDITIEEVEESVSEGGFLSVMINKLFGK